MSDLNQSTGFRCPSCSATHADVHTPACTWHRPSFASFSLDSTGVWMFGALAINVAEADEIDIVTAIDAHES